jgi:uncharacterized membrane protein (GlpM family)
MNLWYYAIKVLLSSLLIVLISEIGKKSGVIAGLLASIPLVSFLAIIWMYVETKDIPRIRQLSSDIFWLVLPSLSFFVVFPWLLGKNMRFGWAMLLSTLLMIILYIILMIILKKNWR